MNLIIPRFGRDYYEAKNVLHQKCHFMTSTMKFQVDDINNKFKSTTKNISD
jgi:hypothetical protein